jgi:esterase/lipase superfamily enzyme
MVQVCTREDIYAACAGQQVLVYIHGFNTPIQSAVLQAVKLRDNMGHNGPLVVYSWASMGSVWLYLMDVSRVRATSTFLYDLLKALVDQVGLVRVSSVVADLWH